jgi:hypothetical protein
MASTPSTGELSAPSATWATLPPEVRIKIYHYLFIAEKIISFEPTEVDLPQLPLEPPQLSSQLLRCSKAILAEAQPILYSNVFDIGIWDDIFRGGKRDRDTNRVFADESKRAFWKSQLRHVTTEDCSANCADLIAQMRQMSHLQSIQMRLMGQYGWEADKDLAPTGVDELIRSRSFYGNRDTWELARDFPNAAIYYCIHLQEKQYSRAKRNMVCATSIAALTPGS